VLQNMRMMSPTGGALGQVSEKENQLLQENLAPLSEKQSLDAMKQHLQDVIQYTEDAKARLRGAYSSSYGDVAPLNAQGGNTQPSASPSQGAALAVGPVEDGYRYIGGDPASKSSWQPVENP